MRRRFLSIIGLYQKVKKNRQFFPFSGRRFLSTFAPIDVQYCLVNIIIRPCHDDVSLHAGTNRISLTSYGHRVKRLEFDYGGTEHDTAVLRTRSVMRFRVSWRSSDYSSPKTDVCDLQSNFGRELILISKVDSRETSQVKNKQEEVLLLRFGELCPIQNFILVFQSYNNDENNG